MFIVNESYSGSGSWKTATCSGARGEGGRVRVANRRDEDAEQKREEDPVG